MSSLSKEEAERKLNVLLSNIRTLSETVKAHQSELGQDFDVLEEEFNRLQEDLNEMEDHYGPVHAYKEGLRRLRRLKTEDTVDDTAIDLIDAEMEESLDQW